MTQNREHSPRITLNTAVFDQAILELGCASNRDAAKIIGVNPSTISRLRAGMHAPSSEVMYKAAEALNVPMLRLFTHHSDDEQEAEHAQ